MTMNDEEKAEVWRQGYDAACAHLELNIYRLALFGVKALDNVKPVPNPYNKGS